MTPASYGSRVGAILLDWLFAIVPTILLFVFGIALAFSETYIGIGILFIVLGSIAWIGLNIWNKVFKEGKSGQSFGKARMKISLVDTNSRQPIGAGRAFLREFVSYLLNTVSGGIFWLIDFLWPLWDQNNERLMDKIMTTRVVTTTSLTRGAPEPELDATSSYS